MDEEGRVTPRFAAQMTGDEDLPLRAPMAPMVRNGPPCAADLPPYRAALTRWRRDAQNRLRGTVYGHALHDNGTILEETTTVLSMWRDGDRLMAQTLHTLFQLTDPDGEAWFSPVAREKRRRVARGTSA